MNFKDLNFQIPAKTFLLGEYVALQGGPAMILTTTPCFEVGVGDLEIQAIHPDSPAGLCWRDSGIPGELFWYDPYEGIGGLGASSAAFLGAYLCSVSNHQQSLNQDALLAAYWGACAKANPGVVRPSGYDVLAQAGDGCVYLNRSISKCQKYGWPFDDIAFILLHTGQKILTHEHLQALYLTEAVQILAPIVDLGKKAFDTLESDLLIEAVQTYAKRLFALGLVASHTQTYLSQFAQNKSVLAAKGCGALGADVLFLLVPKSQLATLVTDFSEQGFRVLASSNDLYNAPRHIIFEKNHRESS